MVHLCQNRDNYEACKNCSFVFFVFILSSAPAIFYPFGAAVGDAHVLETGSETYEHVTFSTPFTYFGRKYNSTYVRIQFYCQSNMNANVVIRQFTVYWLILNQFLLFQVNNNGLITFNQPLPEAHPPYPFPTYGNEDYIAPLWSELDDVGIGIYWYQQYTSGSVLTRATRDINQYFPGRGFSASWVFVVTWDYVLTWDMNVFNSHSGPVNSFFLCFFRQ